MPHPNPSPPIDDEPRRAARSGQQGIRFSSGAAGASAPLRFAGKDLVP